MLAAVLFPENITRPMTDWLPEFWVTDLISHLSKALLSFLSSPFMVQSALDRRKGQRAFGSSRFCVQWELREG